MPASKEKVRRIDFPPSSLTVDRELARFIRGANRMDVNSRVRQGGLP